MIARMTKSLAAAAVLATSLFAALPATQAEAGVKVGIGIGVYPPVAVVPVAPVPVYSGGYGGYDGGYGGGYDGGYRGHDAGYGDGYHGGYRGGDHRPPYDAYVSCRDGRSILWQYGYRGVEVQSCRPGFYRYVAWRNGRQYLMAVDGQGDVSRLRRIY